MNFRNGSKTLSNDDRAKYSARAVERALKILSCFSSWHPQRSYLEVAAEIGAPPSTVFKLMQLLAEQGLLESSGEPGRYRVGLELFRLGNLYLMNRPLVAVAEPHLERLSERLALLASLGVRDGDSLTILATKQGASPIILTRRLGERGPLHLSALGRALLFDMSDEELARTCPNISPVGATAKTVTTLAQLRGELYESRQRGYTVDDEGACIGIYCVGCHIRDHHGNITAAISVSGVKAAMIGRVSEIAAEVCYVAEQISRSLGYNPTEPVTVTSTSVTQRAITAAVW